MELTCQFYVKEVTTIGSQRMWNRSVTCTDTGWITVVLSQFSIYLTKASENCQVSKSV